MAIKLFRLLIFLLCLQGVQLSESDNTQIQLLAYINNQTHSLFPVENYSEAVTVEFGITLIKIKDVNAKEQTIQVHVWITQKWTNPFLKWDEAKFPGISSINVKPDKVWVPDIILYNNVDEQDRIGGGPETYKTLVTLYPNGTNFWSSPALFKTICEIDVSYFPLDQQKCKLKFGSWTYDSTKLILKNANVKFPTCNYIRNGEWAIYSVTSSVNNSTYEGRPETFMDITLNIDMKRQSLDYLINLVIPCLMISSMIFLGFILPPESGERVGLSITVLLAMTVFQQLTSEIMPSYDFPLLGQYYFATILEIGSALLITTIILNFYHRTNRHMPRWLRVVLLDWMSRVVFLHESAKNCSKPRKKTIRRGMRENVDAVINNGFVIGERSMGQENSVGDMGRFGNAKYDGHRNRCDSEDGMRARSNTSSNGKPQSDQNVLKLTLGSIGNELNPNTQNDQGMFTDETGATVSEEEMRMRHRQWTLAAKILDRFFLWVAVIVGIVTVLAMFLRAPGLWESRKELEWKE